MLPIFQMPDTDLNKMQTVWSAQLNPVIANQLVNGQLLKNIELVVGTNSVNHLLARKLIGWMPTRVRALSQIYDNQDNNPTPTKTLLLVSDAAVTIDLWVF